MPRLYAGRKAAPTTCKHCTKRFPLRRADTKFCSGACKVAHHRDLKARRSVACGASEAGLSVTFRNGATSGGTTIALSVTTPPTTKIDQALTEAPTTHLRQHLKPPYDHQLHPWPTSYNVELLYWKIMARDGCVDPTHKRRLATLDDLIGTWPTPVEKADARQQWKAFRKEAEKILEIPCAIPEKMVEEHHAWLVLEETEGGPEGQSPAEAAALVLAAMTPSSRPTTDRWVDRWGFVHRGKRPVTSGPSLIDRYG
jgi:hypothetical protein